ncbi:MAG: site-specific DNA-methyltransferase [Dokdonella sp.]|nr:site-specific DNA-methyltransferase [Dokdonella sp.]
MSRVLKPNASLWIFGSFRSLSSLVVPEMKTHGWKYAQDVIWMKQNGTGFHADRFRRVHEIVVQFYRGPWLAVHKRTQYTHDAKARTVHRKTRPQHTGQINDGHYVSIDGGPRMMTSVLQVRNEHRRAIHPTQKPVELLLPLVRYSCPPGGVVVDCFSGSASLGIAARMAGVAAVLIEKDAGMADASRRRLASDARLLDIAVQSGSARTEHAP